MISFIALFVGISALIFVAHLVFFDWYEKKRNRDTEVWLQANNIRNQT